MNEKIQEIYGPGNEKTISATYLSTLTSSSGLSWKIPVVFQRKKYTPENIAYTKLFLEFIQLVPFEKIKFMDECHFASTGMV